MNEGSPRSPGNTPESQIKAHLAELSRTLSSQDYYTRLGISSSASDEEIRGSLRKFAQFHPAGKDASLQEDYTELFKLYTEAQSTLKNPDSRRKYDATLRYAKPSAAGYSSAHNDAPNYTRSSNTYGQHSTNTAEDEAAKIKEEALSSIHMSVAQGAYAFTRVRDRWIEKGIFTREQINSSKYVRDAAYESIRSGLSGGAYMFTRTRDQWIEAGVLTKNEINTNEGVRSHVRKEIIQRLSLGSYEFSRSRNRWVEAGVVTAQEINQLPEVRAHAFRDIGQKLTLGAYAFTRARDAWVEEGVLRAGEINTHPEVKQFVLKSLLPYLRMGEYAFARASDSWIDAGVITAQEAAALAKK